MSQQDNSSISLGSGNSPNRMRLTEQPNIKILLDEIPKRTNYLSTFKIQDITKPLSLHEEEQIANDLVQSIFEQEKLKEEAYKLPEHLDQIRRLLDPPSKVKKKLPIISQLSPRTKAKLAALPKPNDYELQQIRNIEKMTKVKGTHGIYEEIGARNRLLPVVSNAALQPAISKASSRPTTSSDERPKSAKPGTPAANTKSEKRELPAAQRLQLLLDDDKIEKSLPDIVTLLDNHEENKGEPLKKLTPLTRIVPRENVPIPIKENNAMLIFKQVDEAAKKEVKRKEILHNLLGEVAEIDQQSMAEQIGIHRSIYNGKQTKGLGKSGNALYQPASSSDREMLHSRSSASYQKSRLSQLGGFSLLSHTMNPTYQPLLPALNRTKSSSTLEEQQYLHQFSAKVYDELGINLDAEYNRLRHYRQSLCVFFYYIYVLQVRAGLDRWKRITALLRHQQMLSAQFTLVSFFRKVLYIRKVQRKNYYHDLQKQQEDYRYQQNLKFLRHNAWILFRALYRYWKMAKVKRSLRNRRSTISIQKGIRGFIARRRVQKKIAFLNFLRQNATVIQCIYRRHLAKRRVHLARKLKFIQEYMDFLKQKRLYHESHFHQVGALSRILQNYRLYQLKKRLFNMLFWLKFAKAIIIQRNIRGYLARKKHANFKAARAQRQKLENEAAIKIQCLFRRMHAENRYFALLEERDQKKQKHYEQKLWKLAQGLSFMQRCRMLCVKMYRKLLPFRYLVLNKKATVIQRYYRGYHGRQRMKMVRVYARLRDFYRQRRHYGKYALKIQKHWRGYVTRKKQRHRLRLRMIIKIQCLVRKFLANRKFQRLQKLHRSAHRITRFIRRNNIRRRFHRRYEREQLLGGVVIFLQNFFRVVLARRRHLRRYKTVQNQEEQTLKTQISLIHLLAKIQLKILFETITKPINKKYYTISKEDCPCFGPLQAIFVQLACGQNQKSRMELGTITLNQLDNSRFLKFLSRLPYFMLQKFLNPLKDPKQQQKLLKKKAATNNTDQVLLIDEEEEEKIDQYSLNGIYHPAGLTSMQREAMYLQYTGLVDILQKHRKKTSYASPKYYPVINRPASSPRRSTTPKPLKLIKQKSTLKSQRNLLKNSNSTTTATGKPSPEKGKDSTNGTTGIGQPILKRSALLMVLRNGDIPLPQIQHYITSTEFDILYAKSKLDTNSTNKISYEEFCRCLDYVGEVHYHTTSTDLQTQTNNMIPPSVPTSHDNTATNTAANSVANEQEDDNHTINSNAETIGNNTVTTAAKEETKEGEVKEGIAERANKVADVEGPGPAMQLDKFLARHSDHVNRKTSYINYENLFLQDLSSLLLGNHSNPEAPQSVNYLLVFALRALYFFQDEAVVQPLLSWLEREAYSRLVIFIVKIQSVIRYKLAQAIVRRRKLEKRHEDLQKYQLTKIILIQAVIRRFLVRCQIRRKVKEVILKYIPYLQAPYYYHPKTGVKSYSKPKILTRGNPSDPDDCYAIAVPEKGLENIIYCYQCRYRQAIIFCHQCEDSMCMICYQSLHFKGSKSHHTYQKIPKCSYCQYQVATKSCVTCVTHPPRSGSIQASKTTFSRGLYCDTCFLHEHDAYTKQLENSAEKRQQIRKLLYSSARPNAVLISKFLFQKIITSHYYEALTMNCEECNQLSASWRCYHCQQIYCHRCLIYLHSINPIFVNHQVESLSYYTAKMHKSLQKDLNQMYFVMKWEKCLVKERQRQARIEYFSAIRIQAWYRRFYYGKIGRKYMKRQRLRQRKWWRLRRKENAEIRSQLTYKIQDAVGFAPVLASDTVEEKVLKKLPAWSRQTAREFIWKNQADWGYYRIDSKRPRKGIPKKGFQVGEFEELQDQAKNLGYRLPGRIIVKTAEHVFETTCDLSGIVRPGEIIRIKKYLFGVVSVDQNSIRLNRLWRESKNRFKNHDEEEDGGDDIKEEEDEEDSDYDEEGRPKGQIAYRMPTYTNEKFQWYYRFHFLLYDLTLGNPLVQASLYLYKQYSLRMMNFSLYMMRMNKRSKNYDESYQWKISAVKYADQARKISAYFTTREALIDLTKVTLTEELKSRRFGDKKSSRKQRGGGDEDDDEEGDDEDEEGAQGRRLTGEGEGEEDPLLSAKSMKYGKASRRRRFSLRSSFGGGGGKYAPKASTVLPGDDKDDGDNWEEGLDEGAGDDKDKSTADAKKAKKEKIKKARKQSVLSMMENLSMKSNRFGITKSVKVTDEEEGEEKGKEAGESRSKRRFFEQEVENVAIAKKNLKNPKAKTALLEKKPDKPWFATKEQEMARREREEKMSTAQLALEADDWKEMIDPMTENIYYLNLYTNEMMTTIPRALTAKKQLEFENSKNKKSYDDARRRIDHLELVTKNRLLISGYRKK